MLSNGERLLREYVALLFPGEDVVYNYRPSWLLGLELDIFLPRINLAFEFNGDQHYVDTEFGPCKKQIARDRMKRDLCYKNRVSLVIIEAIDLEYTKLRSKIKVKIRHNKKIALQRMSSGTKKKLSAINKRAIEYRKGLIQKYNSPTARQKGGQPRKDALAERIIS